MKIAHNYLQSKAKLAYDRLLYAVFNKFGINELKVKYQNFPDGILIVTDIKSPDGKCVALVPIEQFSQYEANPYEIDYCSLFNGVLKHKKYGFEQNIQTTIIISSKAKYDHVCVNGFGEEAILDIWRKQNAL